MFFFYDLSSIRVTVTEKSKSLGHFLTSLCAIAGGMFTVGFDRLIDGCMGWTLAQYTSSFPYSTHLRYWPLKCNCTPDVFPPRGTLSVVHNHPLPQVFGVIDSGIHIVFRKYKSSKAIA